MMEYQSRVTAVPEIEALRADVGRLEEMVKRLAASAINVQQGARDMVKFSDDRALEYKHEAERVADLNQDLQDVISDYQRLVRDLDVVWNGEGAAHQASLCDMVAQIRKDVAAMTAAPKR